MEFLNVLQLRKKGKITTKTKEAETHLSAKITMLRPKIDKRLVSIRDSLTMEEEAKNTPHPRNIAYIENKRSSQMFKIFSLYLNYLYLFLTR